VVFIPTLGIHFQYLDAGDIVKEVLIIGSDTPESVEQLRQIHRHLTQGKRETLHIKEPIVRGDHDQRRKASGRDAPQPQTPSLLSCPGA
jgi:hypothetical protein